MPWMPHRLRDSDVWARVDSAGALIQDGDGRVEVVYKPAPGAKVEILADGSIVTVLTQRNHMTATDQASQAARCALALTQRYPDALSTLTTGRALLGGRLRRLAVRRTGAGDQP